jgi:hypothetical protein
MQALTRRRGNVAASKQGSNEAGKDTLKKKRYEAQSALKRVEIDFLWPSPRTEKEAWGWKG